MQCLVLMSEEHVVNIDNNLGALFQLIHLKHSKWFVNSGLESYMVWKSILRNYLVIQTIQDDKETQDHVDIIFNILSYDKTFQVVNKKNVGTRLPIVYCSTLNAALFYVYSIWKSVSKT